MSEELAELRFRRGQARVLRNIGRSAAIGRGDPKVKLLFEMGAEAAAEGVTLEIAGVPAQASLKRARELASAFQQYGAAKPAVILPDCLVGLGL